MDFFDWITQAFGGSQIGALFTYLCILSIFLLIGKLLRVKVKLFQKILLPASVIGGFVGLICGPFILGAALGNESIVKVLESMRIGFGSLPGRLIDIVFATMFLGIAIPKGRDIIRNSGPMLSYSMIVGGPMQHALMGLLVLLVLTPLFGVDPTFGTILEIGFAGGHGTAGGMADLFRNGLGGWSFPAGADLAFTSATVGILTSTIVGIALINLAARKGYTKVLERPQELPEEVRVGIIPPNKRYSISKATVASESIEPLAFHAAMIFVAVFLGYIMDASFSRVGTAIGAYTGNETIAVALDAVPTFPLCMLGGLILQVVLIKTGVSGIIDRDTVERLQGLALEFLVVSAIASISIPVVIEYAVPFFILMAVGITYIVAVTWFIAPRMLSNSWFEKATVEFGMETGVTAMGIMLLRVVDPHFETEASEAFAFKQLIYEPFFGGGFVTAMTPILIVTLGLVKFIGAMLLIALLFGVVLPFATGWLHRRAEPYR
ncbi:MAG: sodium/glutamate symporter [Candidatus Thermoplasmatota archaeon]|nr:sodium/glutamate symporter [Candidatus Thermoplasmatota archaeon]